jgi:hypothetical protein
MPEQAAHKATKSYFYIYSIDKHDKQNILNLKLVMSTMKHKVSTKPLSTPISL